MNQKVRVFELAKELKLTSKELMGELKKMRIEVKSHMSVLEDETVAYIKRHWGDDEMPQDAFVPGMVPLPPAPAPSAAAPAAAVPSTAAKVAEPEPKVTYREPLHEPAPYIPEPLMPEPEPEPEIHALPAG